MQDREHSAFVANPFKDGDFYVIMVEWLGKNCEKTCVMKEVREMQDRGCSVFVANPF